MRFVLFAVLLSAIVICNKLSAHAYCAETGNRAPDIGGWDIVQRRNVQLSDYLGQWVLLEFSAAWCAPCMHELPAILKKSQTYRDDGKLAMIMVSCDSPETLPQLRRVIQQHRIDFPVLYDGGLFNSIPVSEWCGGDTMNFSIPASYLINPQGVIVANQLSGQNIGAALEFFVRANRQVIGLRSRSQKNADGSYSFVAEVVNPRRDPVNLNMDLYWTKWLCDPADPQRNGTDIEPHFVAAAATQLLAFDEFGEAIYTFTFTPDADQDAIGFQFRLVFPGSETLPGCDGQGISLVSGVSQAFLPGVAFVDGSFQVLPD